jgi:hypothetical protein
MPGTQHRVAAHSQEGSCASTGHSPPGDAAVSWQPPAVADTPADTRQGIHPARQP